jgi:hypothetical protein
MTGDCVALLYPVITVIDTSGEMNDPDHAIQA